MVSQTNAQPLCLAYPDIPPDRPTPAPLPPNSSKTKAQPPGKAPAKHPSTDRPASAPPPLSLRQKQVLCQRSEGLSFEMIARALGCSPATVQEHYIRALSKVNRSPELAPPEPAEPPSDRRAEAKRERPNPLELCLPDLFVTGQSVAIGKKLSTERSHFSHTTITDPRHPRRRNRSSRRNGWAGEGDRMAS